MYNRGVYKGTDLYEEYKKGSHDFLGNHNAVGFPAQ